MKRRIIRDALVLDTNVIVAGLRRPAGASAAWLDRALSRSLVLVLSGAFGAGVRGGLPRSGAADRLGPE